MRRTGEPVFTVYCTADTLNQAAGRYAAQVTGDGVVFADRIDRARRFPCQEDARNTASRLARLFPGSAWAPVEVVPIEPWPPNRH